MVKYHFPLAVEKPYRLKDFNVHFTVVYIYTPIDLTSMTVKEPSRLKHTLSVQRVYTVKFGFILQQYQVLSTKTSVKVIGMYMFRGCSAK